jgi:TolB-like protein
MRTSLWTVAAVMALAGAARGDETRVLVIPFNTLNVPQEQQWMGKGVQEAVVADLGRSGNVTPVSFTGKVIVEDNATAARLARSAQSTLAIRGTVQAVGSDVRLTAQLLDARNGDILRTASAAGPAAELLKLEDELGAQLKTPAEAPVATVPATAPAPVAPGAPATASPQIIVVMPPAPQPVPQSYYPPAYDYGYYNQYGYSLGYWGYPVVYYAGSGGGGRHDRDRPGHDRPGDRPDGGRDRPNSGRGGNTVVQVNTTHNSWLPVPTGPGNMPIPKGPGMLPIPTNNVMPVPVKSVAPARSVTTAAPRGAVTAAVTAGAPRSNAGQIR